jgi:hypothetical protein
VDSGALIGCSGFQVSNSAVLQAQSSQSKGCTGFVRTHPPHHSMIPAAYRRYLYLPVLCCQRILRNKQRWPAAFTISVIRLARGNPVDWPAEPLHSKICSHRGPQLSLSPSGICPGDLSTDHALEGCFGSLVVHRPGPFSLHCHLLNNLCSKTNLVNKVIAYAMLIIIISD